MTLLRGSKGFLLLEDGTLFRGHIHAERRAGGRGGRVHDEHERLSGSVHRSVLPRTDRRDDGADDRQLRRQRGGSRIDARAGERRRGTRAFDVILELARGRCAGRLHGECGYPDSVRC